MKRRSLRYRDAGVDIAAGRRAVERIRVMARSVRRPEVVDDIGGFAGLFRLPQGGTLVSATDGVGTKLKLAFDLNRHDTIGIDLVAMNVNDVLCTGAEPLFFLDYLAMGRVDPDRVAEIVSGVVEGCRQAGCALLGGETAEMPGLYAPGEYDLAGFAVGWLPPGKDPVDGRRVRPGDAVVGLASSGLHSNGFSLVRAIVARAGLAWSDVPEGWSLPLGETLLEPTRIYVRPVRAAMERFDVRGLAHITGGGLVDNPPRMLPEGLGLRLDRRAWSEPPVFQWIREAGGVPEDEMRRTFNLGLGMLMVVPPHEADGVVRHMQAAGVPAWVVGETVPRRHGEARVVFGA
ncbi:MAG: phosphoribosylformylglycinamidine cyclo-ligase [Firmicutes bacterium]|nr:phosphoribosylformylglycinamidine cyclo-ligase [Bacillota bacterium]